MLRSRLPGKIIIKGIAADWVTACLSISSPQKCTAPEQLEPILYRTGLGIDGKKNRPFLPFNNLHVIVHTVLNLIGIFIRTPYNYHIRQLYVRSITIRMYQLYRRRDNIGEVKRRTIPGLKPGENRQLRDLELPHIKRGWRKTGRTEIAGLEPVGAFPSIHSIVIVTFPFLQPCSTYRRSNRLRRVCSGARTGI